MDFRRVRRVLKKSSLEELGNVDDILMSNKKFMRFSRARVGHETRQLAKDKMRHGFDKNYITVQKALS
jgi:hypothetical protein